jgi:uncharacterized damage-inducible protein DinB
MSTDHFNLLAGFNAWANHTLFAAAAALPEAEYRKTRSAAYFGSIHGTLNHNLVVDRLWFGRMEGVDPGVSSLDQIVYDDLDSLRAARAAEDARIIETVERLDEASLTREYDYTDTQGRPWRMRVDHTLATVFNHQTHHRGQVHALIKEAGAEPPALDIIMCLREAG